MASPDLDKPGCVLVQQRHSKGSFLVTSLIYEAFIEVNFAGSCAIVIKILAAQVCRHVKI